MERRGSPWQDGDPHGKERFPWQGKGHHGKVGVLLARRRSPWEGGSLHLWEKVSMAG